MGAVIVIYAVYLDLLCLQIDSDQNEEGDWCMGVRFTVRNHNMANEIFKIPQM